MEKTVRDNIIKRTAEDVSLPEEVIEKVVSWSYRKANEATRNLKEVELSGFGTFMVSPSKAKKKIATLQKMIASIELRIAEGKSKNLELDKKKIESCKENINYCLSKLSDEDRAKQDIGRVEQSSIPA